MERGRKRREDRKKETKIHREQDRRIGVGMTTISGERREIHGGNGRQSPHMPGGTRERGVRYCGRGGPAHEGLTVLGRSRSPRSSKVAGGINRLRPCEVDPPSSSSSRYWIQQQQVQRDRRLHRRPVWGSWEDDRVYAWVVDRHLHPQPFSARAGGKVNRRMMNDEKAGRDRWTR